MDMRGLALLLLPAAAFAQGKGFADLFGGAPPHVDSALREKVEFFYQAHKEGKYRKADQVVHESAKDIFFAGEKLQLRDFRIVSITYEDSFAKARSVIDIDTDFFFPGFGKQRVHRPVVAFWQLDQGQWWWYVPPVDRETPFGPMSAPKEAGTGDSGTSGRLDDIWTRQSVKPEDLHKMVRADKDSVTLSSHEPSQAEVVIASTHPGSVTLRLDFPDMPGLAIKLEKTELKQGEATRLLIRCKPDHGRAKKPDLTATVTVEPLGKLIPIQVKFAYPPQP